MTMDVARFEAQQGAYQWRVPCWIVLDTLARSLAGLLRPARRVSPERAGPVLSLGSPLPGGPGREQDRIAVALRVQEADSPQPVAEQGSTTGCAFLEPLIPLRRRLTMLKCFYLLVWCEDSAEWWQADECESAVVAPRHRGTPRAQPAAVSSGPPLGRSAARRLAKALARRPAPAQFADLELAAA